jgi:hypothetical protein
VSVLIQKFGGKIITDIITTIGENTAVRESGNRALKQVGKGQDADCDEKR